MSVRLPVTCPCTPAMAPSVQNWNPRTEFRTHAFRSKIAVVFIRYFRKYWNKLHPKLTLYNLFCYIKAKKQSAFKSLPNGLQLVNTTESLFSEL